MHNSLIADKSNLIVNKLVGKPNLIVN